MDLSMFSIDAIKAFGLEARNLATNTTVTISGTGTDTISPLGYDLVVVRLIPTVIADGLVIPVGVATDLELITVQMKDSGGSDAAYGNIPMEISALAEWGKNDGFLKFGFLADSTMTIDYTHTAKSGGTAYSASLAVRLHFFGMKLPKGKLKELFGGE
jgi:hypothetical protein